MAKVSLPETPIQYAHPGKRRQISRWPEANSERFGPYTGLLAGALLAVLIFMVAPISGTSLNPARTFGSAAVAKVWTALWLYFLAPPIGALLATVVYRWPEKTKQVICAKLYHPKNDRSCIFINCGCKQMD